jgi:hypothetical protein
MKAPYTFCLLRYFYDVFTGEFVNVGVVMYAPGLRFLRFEATSRLSRLTSLFPDTNKDHVRSTLKFLADQFRLLAERMATELPFDEKVASLNARELARTILPEDASAFQWAASVGSGVTDAPDATAQSLYSRLVSAYEKHDAQQRRDDKEVWLPFQQAFIRTGAIYRLSEAEFKYGDYVQKFEHGWKNGNWHIYQPLSFDLIEKRDIVDKAIHWDGRIKRLHKADPSFKMYWLVGAPSRSENASAFSEAKSIFATESQGKSEVVEEAQAESFAKTMAEKMGVI